MTGEVNPIDLVISRQLRMDITKYRNIFPHVAAAIQLSNTSKKPVRGDIIKYIYTNSQHQNPLGRVAIAEEISSGMGVDREKYKEMRQKRFWEYLDLIARSTARLKTRSGG